MPTNIVLLVTVLLFQQVPRQRMPRQPQASVQSGNTAAVATFDGKFKAADKKFITVEVEGGQTLRMYITGSTKFVRDGKPRQSFQL